jgi:hypothetical protein
MNNPRKTISYFLVCVWLITFTLLIVGCGGGASDEDKSAAKAIVEKMLASETYDEFMECFSQDIQQVMKDSGYWRETWENLNKNGDPIWVVTDIEGDEEVIEVFSTNIYLPDSLRSYPVTVINGEWVIDGWNIYLTNE